MNKLAWLLVLGAVSALPLTATAQDFVGLNRTGTGSGGTGTHDGRGLGSTGGVDPVAWSGARHPAYSPEMRLVFEKMLQWYRKHHGYGESYSVSEAEERARANYEKYKDQYQAMRAGGSLLYPHQTPAIRSCLRAYLEAQKAFPGSLQEKVSEYRYEESTRDVEALGLLPEYSVPIGEAHDRYFAHYRKYHEALSGSVEEAYHRQAMDLFEKQVDRARDQGRRLTSGPSEADRERLRWTRERQRSTPGSLDEKVARLQAEVYSRELESHRIGTGNGDFGRPPGSGTGSGTGTGSGPGY